MKFPFKSRIVVSIALVLILGMNNRPKAQVLFDFDNAPLHSSLPFTQTVGGITATFSATGQGFSVQEANVLGFTPLGFSGRVIYPNSVFAADLLVSFNQTITNFSIMYACQELGCDDAATMRVSAYNNGIFVGTATRTATNPGTWPTDTLRCNFSQGFNSVVVHYASHPPTCQDYGVIFMADNMIVTAVNTNVTLHAKMFIEGFYSGNGNMVAAYDPFNSPSVCDYVTVELHNANNPSLVSFTATDVMDINGNITLNFSGALGSSYYIVIRHRNSIET